jgi:hypothetical protein
MNNEFKQFREVIIIIIITVIQICSNKCSTSIIAEDRHSLI